MRKGISIKKKAYIAHILFAGRAIEKNDLDMAMRRYNQAWLIDDANGEAYWGFGIVLNERKQYDESNKMLEAALERYAENKDAMSNLNESNIWRTLAMNHISLIEQTQDSTYITRITDRRLQNTLKAAR